MLPTLSSAIHLTVVGADGRDVEARVDAASTSVPLVTTSLPLIVGALPSVV